VSETYRFEGRRALSDKRRRRVRSHARSWPVAPTLSAGSVEIAVSDSATVGLRGSALGRLRPTAATMLVVVTTSSIRLLTGRTLRLRGSSVPSTSPESTTTPRRHGSGLPKGFSARRLGRAGRYKVVWTRATPAERWLLELSRRDADQTSWLPTRRTPSGAGHPCGPAVARARRRGQRRLLRARTRTCRQDLRSTTRARVPR